MGRKVAGYGWRRDALDSRDHVADVPRYAMPVRVDLRSMLPECWDQGQLGSCTSFGVAASVYAARDRQGEDLFEPSHLFIYWNERDLEGTVESDAGAEIRDGIKVVAKLGVPPEDEWSYTDRGSKWRQRPDKAAFQEAVKHAALTYAAVPKGHVRGALASGWPVVFGFNVYEAFESAEVERTGVVPMPEGSPIGGHCVAAVGYDNVKQMLLCRNSWGTEWGDNGHFWLPFSYANDRSETSDWWQIRLES